MAVGTNQVQGGTNQRQHATSQTATRHQPTARRHQQTADDTNQRQDDTNQRQHGINQRQHGTKLAAHAANQSGHTIIAQSGTKKTTALRKELLQDYMQPIYRIARVKLPHTKELEPMRAPRGNPTTECLAVAARGMAQAAAQYTDIFISAGLPSDFIAKLNAATDAMLPSVDVRGQSLGKSSGATVGLSTSIRTARQNMHILDAFIRTALKDDPSLLANWNRIKSLPRVRENSATPTGTTSTTPTTATSTSTAHPTTTPATPSASVAPSVTPSAPAAPMPATPVPPVAAAS